jgi:hypothetical protein
MSDFQAVPVLTWSVSERSAPSSLNSAEISDLLSAKPRRGKVAMLLIAVIGALACAYFAVIRQSIPWAVVCGMAACFGFYCSIRFGQKVDLASRLATNPQLVFWIHPTLLKQQVSGKTFETPFITLHSKDAGTFEVAMPVDRLVAITHWYQEQNPTVRVGAFDSHAE